MKICATVEDGGTGNNTNGNEKDREILCPFVYGSNPSKIKVL